MASLGFVVLNSTAAPIYSYEVALAKCMRRISTSGRFEKSLDGFEKSSKRFKLLSFFRHLSCNYLQWDISHDSLQAGLNWVFQEFQFDGCKPVLIHKCYSFQTPGPEVGPLPTLSPLTHEPLSCILSMFAGLFTKEKQPGIFPSVCYTCPSAVEEPSGILCRLQPCLGHSSNLIHKIMYKAVSHEHGSLEAVEWWCGLSDVVNH